MVDDDSGVLSVEVALVVLDVRVWVLEFDLEAADVVPAADGVWVVDGVCC